MLPSDTFSVATTFRAMVSMRIQNWMDSDRVDVVGDENEKISLNGDFD